MRRTKSRGQSPLASRSTLPDDQQARVERKQTGKDMSQSKKARGAMHKIKIRGLFGLAGLEIQSENSLLIFAIVLLVLLFMLTAIYMLKTL